MRGTRFALALAALLLLSLEIPAVAYADMGPPILWLGFGLAFLAVVEVVVVAVETPVLKFMLSLSLGRALAAAALANLASALFGVPFATVLTSAAGDSLPGRVSDLLSSSTALGIVASAIAIVLVSFVISSLIEWPVVKWIAKSQWRRSAAAVAVANAVSHTGWFILIIAIGLWTTRG